MHAWIPQACIFGKASLVFGQRVFWNQLGILYQTESFLTACISLVDEPDKPWSSNSRCVRTHEKNSGETVRRLGTIIHSIFCAQSGAGIRLNFWKRWESVSRGSFARTRKLSSFPFSRPHWLPLGIRGWKSGCGPPSISRLYWMRGSTSCSPFGCQAAPYRVSAFGWFFINVI